MGHRGRVVDSRLHGNAPAGAGVWSGADAGIVEQTLVSSTGSDRRSHLSLTDRVFCDTGGLKSKLPYLSYKTFEI